MKTVISSALLITIAMSPTAVTAADRAAFSDRAALQLRVTRDEGTKAATCVLVQRQDGSTGAVLSFLTASSVFMTSHGEALPFARAITIRSGVETVEVRPQDVILPAGQTIDIAILRATVAYTAWTPPAIVFDVPPAGSAFLVAGFDRRDSPAVVTERVTHRATSIVLGDRNLASLDACIGAPAIAGGGVFGLVTDCPPSGPPIVSLLSMVRTSIAPHVPGFGVGPLPTLTRSSGSPAATPPAGTAVVGRPQPDAGRATRLGVANQPAEGRLTPGTAPLHLADVSVLPLGNRTMKLRLTVGVPSTAIFPSTGPHPWSVPLASVGVDAFLLGPGE